MQTAQQPEKKKGRGCFFYGCITLVVATVLIVGLTVGGAYFGIKKLVNEYTTDTPLNIPVVEVSPEELSQIQGKLSGFEQDGSNPLVLTAHEINALISGDPRFSEIKGKAAVQIDGGKISGTVSIPLEELGFEGRYINGTATFALTKGPSGPGLYIEQLSVSGNTIPEAIMQELRKQDLLEDVRRQPQNKELIDNLDRIEVGADSITIFAPRSEPSGEQL